MYDETVLPGTERPFDNGISMALQRSTLHRACKLQVTSAGRGLYQNNGLTRQIFIFLNPRGDYVL
jgi:hypothetical protein